MARLEAHLTGLLGDAVLLNHGPSGLSVQVQLELCNPDEAGVLVSSREGMGRGAPLSHQALEQVLAGLMRLGEPAVIRFRSDRDGPVRQAMTAH